MSMQGCIVAVMRVNTPNSKSGLPEDEPALPFRWLFAAGAWFVLCVGALVGMAVTGLSSVFVWGWLALSAIQMVFIGTSVAKFLGFDLELPAVPAPTMEPPVPAPPVAVPSSRPLSIIGIGSSGRVDTSERMSDHRLMYEDEVAGQPGT